MLKDPIYKACGLSNLHNVFILKPKTVSGVKTGAFYLDLGPVKV
jgi:hypothetical protein